LSGSPIAFMFGVNPAAAKFKRSLPAKTSI
jgi:hypothetical protein